MEHTSLNIGRLFKNEVIKRPKYLFKYHQMNLHLMEMFTNAKFYMSNKSDLNDPLDLSYTISLENYLNIYLEKHPHVKHEKESLEYITDRFKRNIETGDKNWIDDIDELQSKLRICCFTEEANNPLMWSHYASNHTGVCLTFELAKDPVFPDSLYPVSYNKELIDAREPSDFIKCLLTKLEAWKIEKEWRIISEKEKFAFKQEALVEIVFGLKVADSTIDWFKYFSENAYFGHAPIYKLKLRGNRLVKVDQYDDEYPIDFIKDVTSPYRENLL